MSFRLLWSATMSSWITVTILFVLAAFALAFGLCEWLAWRRRSDAGDGPAAG